MTWSAFECASLAEKAGDMQEQARLFELGYEQGLKLIQAIQAGKVDTAFLSRSAPVGMVLRLSGPNPEFMLGRVFEAAIDNVLDSLPDAQEQLAARNAFRQRNCDLLGK